MCVATGLILAFPGAAAAHIQLLAPKQRSLDQKVGPCGEQGGTRTANVCEFRPGTEITIAWDEVIDHPGHFRVSFDRDGVDDLIDPKGYDSFNVAPSVLLDNIPDRNTLDGNTRYSVKVRLPNVECDNCTLQLIQVMNDKMPWGDGNDIYYQCADIVLSRAAPAHPAPGCAAAGDGVPGGADGGGDDGSGGDRAGGGSTDAGGGCTVAGDSPARLLGAFVTMVAALALCRRRRRSARARDLGARPR